MTDLLHPLFLLGVQGICQGSGHWMPSLPAALINLEFKQPLLELPCLLCRGRAEGVACTSVGWLRRDAAASWAAACPGAGQGALGPCTAA